MLLERKHVSDFEQVLKEIDFRTSDVLRCRPKAQVWWPSFLVFWLQLLAFTLQIIDLKRDPYGTLDKRGKPTIKTLGNVPKNPLQTMEDKLRIANKVNKKYKELMNELDETIKQATEDIGNDEAKALLENRPRNLTVEKCKNL